MVLAKRPKTAAYTLVAVVLFAALLVGCTFTDARTSVPAAADDAQTKQEEAAKATAPKQAAVLPVNDQEAAVKLDGELQTLKAQAGSELELLKELGHHRTIRQENSARYFGTRQRLKNAGILDVFQVFQTAILGQKMDVQNDAGICSRK